MTRENALEKVEEYLTSHLPVEDYEEVEEILKTLKQIPSISPQPKTGHWIKKEDAFCWWYECDKCGKKPLHNRSNDEDALSGWCPNCGAKMKYEF